MPSLPRRAENPLRRGRSAGGIAFASLVLAAALALCAPLVHVHLEAGASAQGFCGDHLPAGAPAPSGDACSLCLAGAHAPALREPDLLRWELRAAGSEAVPIAADLDLGLARGRPGTPRAPPLTA